jgi:integrase
MDLLYLTDQRIGDVLKIDTKHVLDDGPGIYFRQQKTGKELIVRWNEQLREAVARARALHGSVEPVNFANKAARPLLRNRRGKAPDYSTVALQWRTACRLVEVEDSHIHDIRAMATTDAKRQGKDPQKIAGHEDARTTKIYLRGLEVEIVDGPIMAKRTA